MTRPKILLSVLGSGISLTGSAWCSPARGLDRADPFALLDEARTEMGMPGLRVAVRFAEGGLVRTAVGLGDVENSIGLDSTIGSSGGSTENDLVAALVMPLVES